MTNLLIIFFSKEKVYLNGSRARPDNETFNPEPDKGRKGAEGREYVGIVSSRLLYHTPKLSVAVRP